MARRKHQCNDIDARRARYYGAGVNSEGMTVIGIELQHFLVMVAVGAAAGALVWLLNRWASGQWRRSRPEQGSV